jgi:lipopolysaccharide/colanic/teichoic acid biosynthesis glycosyltransferase
MPFVPCEHDDCTNPRCDAEAAVVGFRQQRELALPSHTGEILVMQAAASQTVDVRIRRGNRKTQNQGKTHLVRESVGAVELVRPIATTPLADVDVLSAKSVDVTPRERSETLSRAVNVVVSAVALVVLFPLMVLVAIAIRLTSRGPVFYSQTRVGLDRRFEGATNDERRRHNLGGKLFMMYKFRTMRVDAEIDGRAVWAQKQDPRVTPIGRFLRSTRLDELPQLYNVLRGDMNIVGPRPERPTIFARLRDDIPEYHLRQRVRPGITGWAQINQSYDACVDDVRRKVHYDLEYLRRQGVVEDLRIMSMTLPVMILRKGAQ